MSNEIEVITEDKIQEYINAFMTGNNLTKPETMQFIEIAKAFQLNPFKREIYCIAYGSGDKRKLSILTGYEVYLKRAERLKSLDGWSVEVKGDLKPVKKNIFRYGKSQTIDTWSGDLSATITIHRKDWKAPFIHSVDFDEYNQNNDIWISKPKTMIKKVAIAQGFRLCFPDEMGGMPYTSDELPEEMTTERVINEAPQGAVASPTKASGQKEPVKQTASSGMIAGKIGKDIKQKVLNIIQEKDVLSKLSMEDMNLLAEIKAGTKALNAKQYQELYNKFETYRKPAEPPKPAVLQTEDAQEPDRDPFQDDVLNKPNTDLPPGVM